MAHRSCFLAGLVLAVVPWTGLRSQFRVDVETGAAFSGYNNVAIPGKTGTRLSLSEELSSNPVPFVRIRVGRTFGAKHDFSVLAAPLRIRSSGRVDRPVFFEGVRFPAQAPLESRFRFDSYRLTYRYDFLRKQSWTAGVGISAKIRDASISLKSPGLFSEKKNTGFVPLVHFRIHGEPHRRLGILVEGDALAGPQGRAEDVLIAGTLRLFSKIRMKFGYRILEGGADVEQTYNFTLVHYAVAGILVGM